MTRHGLWLGVALLLLAVGVTSSVLVARSIARSNDNQDRQRFNATSEQVASTLRLAIQRQQDLVNNATSLVHAAPTMSNADFVRWNSRVRLDERAQDTSLAFVSMVRASELRAVTRRIKRDPPRFAQSGPPTEVSPPGRRPFYCFVSLSTKPMPGLTTPILLDICSPSWPASDDLLKARDSGVGNYTPVTVQKRTFLGVQSPVYRGTVKPKTVAGRRKAMVGWVIMIILPASVLERALVGHPDTSATIRYRDAGSDVSFSRGKAPSGGRAATLAAGTGWTVRVRGARADRGLLAGHEASMILFAGIGLTGLLSLLVLVLGTGRTRARRLVRLKTNELSHLALHDSLTDLPNRALVMERAEKLVVRAGKGHDDIAALFIDVDGFKQINDEYGHAAGDAVLKAVGRRLKGVVRERDTVGRLGGDEFVVLLESTSGGATPEMVAERLVEKLHEPIALEPEGRLISVSASIGIATGSRDNADELLRDADLALYSAKEAGKDRYVLYQAGVRADPAARPNALTTRPSPRREGLSG